MNQNNVSLLRDHDCRSIDGIIRSNSTLWDILVVVLLLGLFGNIINVTVFRHASVKSIQSSLFRFLAICNVLQLLGTAVLTFLNDPPIWERWVLILFLPRFLGTPGYLEMNYNPQYMAGFLFMALHTVSTLLNITLICSRRSEIVKPLRFVRLIVIGALVLGFALSSPLLFAIAEITGTSDEEHAILESPGGYEWSTVATAIIRVLLFVALSGCIIAFIFGIVRSYCRRQCPSTAPPFMIKVSEGEPSASQTTKPFTDTTLLIHVLIFAVLEIPILWASFLLAILWPDDRSQPAFKWCHFEMVANINVLILPAMLINCSYTGFGFLWMSAKYPGTSSVVKSELGSSISTGQKQTVKFVKKVKSSLCSSGS